MSRALTRPAGSARRMAGALFMLGAATATPATAARAQIFAGDTIRLSVRDLEVRRGTYVRADSEALYLRTLGGGGVVRTPYADYTRADLLQGRTRAGGRAVAIGTAIGSGVGAVLGLASVGIHPGHGGVSGRGTNVVVATVLGAALGATIGTASSGIEREVWRPVDIQQLARSAAIASTAADTIVRVFPAPAITATARPVRDPGVVSVGDTVRLYQGKVEIVRGVLVDMDSADFRVAPMNGGVPLYYRRNEFSLTEVRRGDRRRGMRAMGKGAVIGVGVGAALVTLSIATRDPRNEGLEVVVGLALGAASSIIGTAAGGVAALTYTDQWLPFDPITLRVVPAAQ